MLDRAFPQIAQVQGCCRLRMIRVSSMKDINLVLCQKEQDLDRVRREIQGLLTVIPLLEDDQPSSDNVMHLLRCAIDKRVVESDNGVASLKTDYPFVRNMRLSEGRERAAVAPSLNPRHHQPNEPVFFPIVCSPWS